jgi:glutathione S-transferase
MGDTFTSVDAACLPWLVRLPTLAHYRGYALPADCGALAAYIEVVRGHPAVRARRGAPPHG